jgi:two-component system, cell cycle response regulator
VAALPVILIDPSDAGGVLAERLRMQGYAVTVTASPIEGASFALADPPAAVIADLWMSGISGVQLTRLLRAEVATERVPVILRGPEGDRQNRFWAERAGAAAYVGQGRMGELVRALATAIANNPPPEDSFMQVYGGEEFDLRNRIAAHLDAALFESVLAAEVRALSACGSFARLLDLLAQFVSRVTSYRWLAVYTGEPERLGLHAHPAARAQCEEEARKALKPTIGAHALVLTVEDQDAYADASGAPPILREIRLGTEVIGTVALAPRETPHPKDIELVSIVARELAGPLRIAALVEESQRLATTDPLTGLMNRRAFSAAAEREVERATRYKSPFAVLMLDVDRFKSINDKRGHSSGDAVLAAIGQLLGAQLRKLDFVGRWGGEEFTVALPSTDIEGAAIVAERIRAAIAAMVVKDARRDPIAVTASIGVAPYRDGDTVDALVDRADRAMYVAKTSGRDRVSVAPPVAKPEPIADATTAPILTPVQ